jgi:arylsulfatase A-like enzyme
MSISGNLLLAGIFLFLSIGFLIAKDGKPNILFIAVDDLRPELGCYGNQVIHSPNIDKLAAEASVFTNHFVQVPTCGASRFSLLTGMRPRKRSHLSNNVIIEELSEKPEGNRPETFVHHLRRNGYYTIGIGKISHSADGLVYDYNDPVSEKRELPHSWDELLFDNGKWGTGWNAFFGYSDGENRQSMKKRVKPYEAGEVDDHGYPDGLTADLAISRLREIHKKEQPFFLGVGFFKPHLPFNSPDKYWGLYNRDSIPVSPNQDIPLNINLKSLHGSGEFNQYQLSDEFASLDQSVSDEYAMKLIHAYYACVSYIDHQVGRLLRELESLGLADNTIVVIWGDHGWHLGDQRIWGKHTIFENALKSVLIISDPRKPEAERKIRTVVETVDIYPTLMELCGVEMPYDMDGDSFVNLMVGSNNRETEVPDDHVAYGYFRDGISLRTDRYHLTKYFRVEEPVIELYDHLVDPYETINIADKEPEIVNTLMPVLERGNTGLYKQD